jgi:hypothetical protein
LISPQDRINEKISETKSIIGATNEMLGKLNLPDFAKEIQISSFQSRLDSLEMELLETERTIEIEELVLTMHPGGLPSGHISVRSLTMILGGFQNLSDSIANTLYNQPSEKGKIPQEILDFNELIFKEARAGSFKAVMELKHSRQGTFDEPVQTQTLTELFDLLYSSEAEENLTESISYLGPRALRNYSEWTKILRDMDTAVDVEWMSSFKGFSRVTINPEKADKIYKILSDFSETTEEEIKVIGRLMGANVRTKTFEINSYDGEKISGRITKDALPVVAAFVLSESCEASLLKVTTRSSSREKIAWTLKDIKQI